MPFIRRSRSRTSDVNVSSADSSTSTERKPLDGSQNIGARAIASFRPLQVKRCLVTA